MVPATCIVSQNESQASTRYDPPGIGTQHAKARPPLHEVQSVFQSKSQSYQVSQCLATRLEVLLRCPEGVRASFQVTDSTAAGTTSSASHGKRTSPQQQEVVDGDGDLRREIMHRVIVSPHELQQASQQQSVSSSFASPGLALTEVQLSWLCDHPKPDLCRKRYLHSWPAGRQRAAVSAFARLELGDSRKGDSL